MTYKLQDGSEETARISVTDTYGILPIANELLIALTYEGKDSDHVADALAQFESQAIDLSNSLGGDLTNSFNEHLKQQQTEFHWNEDEDSFIEALNPTLNQLNSEVQSPQYSVYKVRQDIGIISDALATYVSDFGLNDDDEARLEKINTNIKMLHETLDSPTTLGVVHIYDGTNTTTRKMNLHDLTEEIAENISFLNYAE